jgi:hypothetical protein
MNLKYLSEIHVFHHLVDRIRNAKFLVIHHLVLVYKLTLVLHQTVVPNAVLIPIVRVTKPA